MLIKKGEYRMKVTKGAWVKSPEKGTLGVQVDVVAMVDGKATSFRAKPRWTTGNTIERVKADLRAMGWDGKSAAELGGLGSIEFQGVLVEDQRTTADDGRILDVEIKWMNRVGGGGELQAASLGEVEAFFANPPPPKRREETASDMPSDDRFA